MGLTCNTCDGYSRDATGPELVPFCLIHHCALHTSRGVVGCGIFDLACADAFSMAFAVCRGTPEHPLREPEDIYAAKVTAVSAAAAKMGISTGMTGLEAVEKMLAQ